MFNALLETFPYDITCMSRFSYLKEFVRLNSKHCVFINSLTYQACSHSLLLLILFIMTHRHLFFSHLKFFLLFHFFSPKFCHLSSFCVYPSVIPTFSYASLLSSMDSWHEIFRLCPNHITNSKQDMSRAFKLEN